MSARSLATDVPKQVNDATLKHPINLASINKLIQMCTLFLSSVLLLCFCVFSMLRSLLSDLLIQ